MFIIYMTTFGLQRVSAEIGLRQVIHNNIK